MFCYIVSNILLIFIRKIINCRNYFLSGVVLKIFPNFRWYWNCDDVSKSARSGLSSGSNKLENKIWWTSSHNNPEVKISLWKLIIFVRQGNIVIIIYHSMMSKTLHKNISWRDQFYCQIKPATRRKSCFTPSEIYSCFICSSSGPSLLAMPRCFLAKQSNSNCTDKLEWRSSEGKKQSDMSGSEDNWVFEYSFRRWLKKSFMRYFLIHEKEVGKERKGERFSSNTWEIHKDWRGSKI